MRMSFADVETDCVLYVYDAQFRRRRILFNLSMFVDGEERMDQ